MKLGIVLIAVLGVPVFASAQTGIKPCEDLKAEIAKKLEAKGVTGYTLTIVDKGKEAEGKVVGSCEGGTKSIVYERGKTAAQREPKKSK